jgi:hypothetical protein
LRSGAAAEVMEEWLPEGLEVLEAHVSSRDAASARMLMLRPPAADRGVGLDSEAALGDHLNLNTKEEVYREKKIM